MANLIFCPFTRPFVNICNYGTCVGSTQSAPAERLTSTVRTQPAAHFLWFKVTRVPRVHLHCAGQFPQDQHCYLNLIRIHHYLVAYRRGEGRFEGITHLRARCEGGQTTPPPLKKPHVNKYSKSCTKTDFLLFYWF